MNSKNLFSHGIVIITFLFFLGVVARANDCSSVPGNNASFVIPTDLEYTYNNITIDGEDQILPAEPLLFTATTLHSAVLVTWEMQGKTNNNYFTLWRTQGGVQFYEIARITAAGTAIQAQQYSFTDENPYQGISYYLLSKTDSDGSTTFYHVVPVYFSNSPENIEVSEPTLVKVSVERK
ncbi:MAG: hypothetical protein FWC39_08175 [Bacteroidetes bacterium]|nr:hypothetical protein [Bacteroidota bacterium]